jgi:hypothetical protein
MPVVNLASATKFNRANQIVTDIGTAGYMLLYSGSVPISPDLPVTGTLLATLPLSNVAGVVSLAVMNAAITAAGTGGTDGTYALTFIDGGGSGASGYYIVTHGVLTSITMTAYGSDYTDLPFVGGFGTAGLTGATAVAVMTALITFNPILTATAVANGTAGWARMATASGDGIIDLDVGTTNTASVVMDNAYVSIGGAVTCSTEVLIES